MTEQNLHNIDRPVILVVEDDSLVRMEATEALFENGFDVICAADGEQALTILEIEAGRVAAIFTDVHMPGRMSGTTLAAQAFSRWPSISIAICSGKSAKEIGDVPKKSRFFPKPYNIQEVASHLWSSLVMVSQFH